MVIKLSNELQRADKGFAGFLKSLTMTDTDRANAANRRVIEYQPCSVDAFFEPNRGVYNAVISGGENRMRVNAMVAQAICAMKNNFPVVILHQGNRELENQMRSTFFGSGKYIEVSSRTPCFEPFFSLNELEIANQILETAPKEYDIRFSARYYIEGVSGYLNKSGKHLSFNLFSTCPHALLFDKVEDLRLQGRITDAEEQEIKSKLMMGQSENYKLDTYMASLKMEISSLMYVPRNGQHPTNIISALNDQVVFCIDVTSATNKLLLNTLIFQLKLALTKGLRYTLLVDAIPLNANEAYANYLKTPTDRICTMISSDDFYSMMGGDERAFSTLIGNSQITVVMSHNSGNSATKWAEVFGQYDKYETSYSRSKGSSRRTPFSLFASPHQSSSVSISERREYVVKPEAIMRMGYGEAYVLTAARGELAHLILNG